MLLNQSMTIYWFDPFRCPFVRFFQFVCNQSQFQHNLAMPKQPSGRNSAKTARKKYVTKVVAEEKADEGESVVKTFDEFDLDDRLLKVASNSTNLPICRASRVSAGRGARRCSRR